MVHRRLTFLLGVLVVLAGPGCAPVFIDRKPSGFPSAAGSPAAALPLAQATAPGPMAQSAHLDDLVPGHIPAAQTANVSQPLQTPSNRFTSASTPDSRLEFLLADLDQALNSPGSELPPHYQDYLRQQLTAIAARSGAALDAQPATTADAQLPSASDSGPVRPVVFNSAADPMEPERSPESSNASQEVTQAAPENSATASSSSEDSPGTWRDHLKKALDSLEQERERSELGEREGEHLAASARLLHLVANHRDQAVAEIEQMNEDEREYWKHQIHALIVALDSENKHAGSRRAALALREIRDAADHLANLSALDVRHLAFCESVKSFGVYTPVKSSALKPGQEVLLYVEIDNFVSEQVDDRYETKLQAEYHITAENGERISKQLPLVEESGRNRRRDYFISYQMEIPKDLRPGEYSLQLIIEDVIGRKSSQASLDFRVR